MIRVSNHLCRMSSVFRCEFNRYSKLASFAILPLEKTRGYIASQGRLPLSDERFWERIKQIPAFNVNVDEPVVIGETAFSNLEELQTYMALSCTKTSKFVDQYLIESEFNGIVLDLGSGIGANAVPLVTKGCNVTIIEKRNEVVSEYKSRETMSCLDILQRNNEENRGQLRTANIIVGDITTETYPSNVDAVICVDTLPYLRPSLLKITMEKIFQSVRPGGVFIGTIFFKTHEEENAFTDAMGKMGTHFYPDSVFAHEIVTRSGFQVKNEYKRKDGGDFFPPFCLEFYAVKPE